MTAKQILDQMRPLAKESYKKVLLKHGISEPVLGVSVEEMKKIQKKVKTDYQLALDLFDTGIYDAMYLAGLIADDAKMTRKDLENWVKKADGGPLCGSTVAWVTAGSNHGRELAMEWINSKDEKTVVTGWATLSSLVAIKPDEELNLDELKKLLQRIAKSLHNEPDKIRYAMNGFVIAVGTYVAPLSDFALSIGEKNGKITVDMGDTSCKVPFAPDYIRKAIDRGSVGKKRKTAKC